MIGDPDLSVGSLNDRVKLDRDQIALDAALQIEEAIARFIKGPQRMARIQLIVLAAMKAQFSGGTCSGGEGT